jgi:hypothetical protein
LAQEAAMVMPQSTIENRQSQITNRKSQFTGEVMHGNSEHTFAIDDW